MIHPLCWLGLHSWHSWFDGTGPQLLKGRMCSRCEKIQWDRETYVRQYYDKYGDVPMSERQLKSMARWKRKNKWGRKI